jgi:hypothetical protein
MKNMKVRRVLVWLLTLLILVAIIGCTTHYRVTDPTTEKDYYTTEIKKEGGGSVKFIDEKTNKSITLNSSEIEEISEEEYNKGIYSE